MLGGISKVVSFKFARITTEHLAKFIATAKIKRKVEIVSLKRFPNKLTGSLFSFKITNAIRKVKFRALKRESMIGQAPCIHEIFVVATQSASSSKVSYGLIGYLQYILIID
jgi:hypothetical protein